MARHDDAAELVKQGHSPKAIALSWGVSVTSVTQCLTVAVGRGLLYRSEILFAIGESTVKGVDVAAEKYGLRTRWDLQRLLRQALPTIEQGTMDELLFCFDLRSAPLADMYELLCNLERYLHTYVRTKMEAVFGPKEWWSKLPKKVRDDCNDTKEEINDPEHQDDPYRFTTFIHLRVIFEDLWNELSQGLPKKVASNRKSFLSDLTALNGIRNRVMHPIRGYRPSKADFEFVRNFVDRVFVDVDVAH
jgi:hypothetical protein